MINKKANINIVQGRNKLNYADVNVVIDVIRAFTVSHYAFLNGIEEVLLVDSIEEAHALKATRENSILSGEVKGYKIDSFDLGNSPYELNESILDGKSLIQKTTNGVSVTLMSLDAEHVLVTGYSNTPATIEYLRNYINTSAKDDLTINLIASHPDGDDDRACAEFMKASIEQVDKRSLKSREEETIYRIMNSDAAQKFYDINNHDFSPLDINLCLIKGKSSFIMKVNTDESTTKIIKELI